MPGTKLPLWRDIAYWSLFSAEWELSPLGFSQTTGELGKELLSLDFHEENKKDAEHIPS